MRLMSLFQIIHLNSHWETTEDGHNKAKIAIITVHSAQLSQNHTKTYINANNSYLFTNLNRKMKHTIYSQNSMGQMEQE